jgi:hypothetical protein
MTAKLYRVHTTTDDFKGYDGVLITWVAVGRQTPPAPYAEAIWGLSANAEPDPYQRGAVDELFTLEEAEAWVTYLRKHYGDESAEIAEQPLPLKGNTIGLSDIPVGGGVDLLMPVREGDYPFPFQVYGYYDLRHHGDEDEGTGEDEARALMIRLLDDVLSSHEIGELRVVRAALSGLRLEPESSRSTARFLRRYLGESVEEDF